MTILGIDPGSKGAAVRMTGSTVEAMVRFGNIEPRDLPAAIAETLDGVTLAITEAAFDLPGEAASRARSGGLLQGLVYAPIYRVDIPLLEVKAQVWQSAVGVHPTSRTKRKPHETKRDWRRRSSADYRAHKKQMHELAKRLYGDQVKVTADVADALLIARFGVELRPAQVRLLLESA